MKRDPGLSEGVAWMKHGKRLFTIRKRFSLWSYSVFLNIERKSAFPVQQLSVSRIRATPSCMPGYSLLRTLLRGLKKGFWNSSDLKYEYLYLVDCRQLLQSESKKGSNSPKERLWSQFEPTDFLNPKLEYQSNSKYTPI